MANHDSESPCATRLNTVGVPAGSVIAGPRRRSSRKDGEDIRCGETGENRRGRWRASATG